MMMLQLSDMSSGGKQMSMHVLMKICAGRGSRLAEPEAPLSVSLRQLFGCLYKYVLQVAQVTASVSNLVGLTV